MRVLDLCAGAGGWHVAATRCGWNVVLSVDICSSVQKYHGINHGTPFLVGDLQKPEDVDRICNLAPPGLEVITASPPCTPFSSAGVHRKGDPRAQVAVACARVACKLLPLAFVLENTSHFCTSAANPVWTTTIQPMLIAAGYTITVVKSCLSRLGIPSSRKRVFCIATRHTPPPELAISHQELRRKPRMALSEWIGAMHYRSHPCRSSPGIFDSTRGPCPASRTSSLTRIDEATYRPRHGDSAPLHQSRELTRDERLRLAGMPDWHTWPDEEERCLDPECCARNGTPRFSLAGVMSGNICAPAQAEYVLRRLGLTVERVESPFDKARAYRMGTIGDKVIPDLALRWHSRLGHPGITKLKEAMREQPDTTEKPSTAEIDALGFCRTCARSKQHKGPHGRKQTVRERARFQNALLHVDTCFRRYPDPSGNTMTMLCVDDFSRWATAEHYSSRRKKPFQEMLRRIEGRVHAQSRQCHEALTVPGMENGRPPLCFRTDGEGSILSKENVDRLLAKKEPIDIDQTTPGALPHPRLG